MTAFALVVLFAYLLGSLSFAIIISRGLHLGDPRTYGSGNPGATNVLRSGHRGAAALTLLFDALKGMVPVWLAQHGASAWGWDANLAPMAGLAAFLGHLWPVFFQFKGGKGVATAAGVLLALDVWLGLAAVLSWLFMAWCFRYSSLSALTAALVAPAQALVVGGVNVAACAVLAMSMLLIWRHRTNLVKLVQGTESKLGARKAAAQVEPEGASTLTPKPPPSSRN